MNCDVLLLAAGYGERLRPLTNEVPKPLLQVAGRPLIEYSLELLRRAGVKELFINLHYRGGQIRDHVGDGSRWGLKVIYSEEAVLLDAGGAIKNIERRLKHSRLLTVNSDIIVGEDFSIPALLAAHEGNGAKPVITAVLRADPEAKSYGEIGVDSAGRIGSFRGKIFLDDRPLTPLMFTGVQVLEKRALKFMPRPGAVFSTTRDTWVKLLQSQEFLWSYRYDGYWSDIGTAEKLDEASKVLLGILAGPS